MSQRPSRLETAADDAAISGLTPDEALRRLHARRVPGLVLLESLGPLTEHSRCSLLSAGPVQVQRALPERPAGGAALSTPTGLFPAWLGGLKYEAAAGWGLPTHAADEAAQHWGLYPSGLVWDRQTGRCRVVGPPHLDWAGLLAGPAPDPPALQVGGFSADDLDYAAGVRAVQQHILAGEVYQVNLSRGVTAAACGAPLAAYLRLRAQNPGGYMAYAELGGEVVVSCSPERLVRWAGGTVSARPIAGTRGRGHTRQHDAALEAELRADPKEQAEHLMLVDLIRHDLGWLAVPGSVTVPEYRCVERYSHVMHLVSEVCGQARRDLSVQDVVGATFPGGTITGAPKRRVMQEIKQLEPGPRGWYTGSVGIISAEHVELNILIRTAAFRPVPGSEDRWTVSVRAGAGIVMDSDPGRETQETVLKAQALLEALTGEPAGVQPSAAPPNPDQHSPGKPWAPAAVQGRVTLPLRVLLLDNFDSFTQNLAHDLAAHGAQVLLCPNTTPLEELLALGAHAVLVGPGPGTPATSGVTLPLTRACLAVGLPLLGVCLGHQALGEVLGGRVVRARRALHGQPEPLTHIGVGLFAGVPQGAVFTRYHSLIVEGLPAAQVTATSGSGEVMALSAGHAPAWGVQVHPESLLSTHGRTVTGNWLRLARAHRPRHATVAR